MLIFNNFKSTTYRRNGSNHDLLDSVHSKYFETFDGGSSVPRLVAP